jgi:hypothetical protein
MRARSRSRFRSGLILAGLTVSFGACGGRSTIDFGAPPASTTTNTGGSTGGVGASGGTNPGGTGGIGGGPDGGAGGVTGGTGGGTALCDQPANDCEKCTCTSCFGQLEACFNDGGCLDILDCADQNGCKGAQCYLGPCNQVIDQNGGPFGDSATIAQQVGQCRTQSNCSCRG